MTNDIAIRFLEPEAAEAVALLAAQMNPPALHPLMIASCPGYARYVRRVLSVPSGEREAFFVGALSQGELLGHLEFRPLRERGALAMNGIAVDRAARAAGVGRRLHDAAVDYAQREGYARLECDVFDGNERARGWFQRLGFSVMHQTLWTIGPSPAELGDDGASASPVSIREFAQAEASQEAYGFSSFRARTARGEFSIGRIRDEYFRVTDAAALEDRDLLRALGRLDPKRRLLGISRGGAARPDGFEVVASATRMELQLP
ncbi:MAG: N-acetyltransferase family protein [Planctomycetota bacterium]